ncbi:hypothetical protein [Rhodopseudomonas sp. BAL398]|nr:hypothetical protein [Rhodopseudomonas sp. BAL398]MDF3810367.1 hypothetical protein [Rhodopseudomonas sp. BAL398]WOK19984.1 hypothetical protein RBJ75_10915 [Rhodopseudomonas sp. BAL398]
MATARTTRPARLPAGRRVVSSASSATRTKSAGSAETAVAEKSSSKKPAAKKPAAKKSVSKKSVSEKPVAKATGSKTSAAPNLTMAERRALKAERDRAVASRAAARATKDKTLICGDIDAVAAPDDAAAQAAIAKKAKNTKKTNTKTTSRPRIRSAVERLDDPPPASGLPLIDSVLNSIERELSQIDRIVGGGHVAKDQRSEAERRARTLASLARTLGAVRKLRAEEAPKRSPDVDAIPRDLDELRRALSRRLEQMVEGATQLSAAGDE